MHSGIFVVFSDIQVSYHRDSVYRDFLFIQSRLPCVFQQLTLGLSLGIAVVVLTRDLILTLFQFIWQQTDNLLTTVKCVVHPPFVMLC